MGAQFMQQRYGPRWATPSFVLAGYTGASRVYGQKHYMDDVLSGMSIALLSGWYFVKPIDDRVAVSPLSVDGGYGIALNIRERSHAAEETPEADPEPAKPKKWRYEWEFGGAYADTNVTQAPPDEGTRVDYLFDESNNPTTTAVVGLEYSPRPRCQWRFEIGPFEVREEGVLAQDVLFNGVLYEEGSTVVTRYLLYDWRARYAYRFLPSSRLQLMAGGGLSYQDTVLTGANVVGEEGNEELTNLTEITEGNFVPFVYGRLGYEFGGKRHWILAGEAHWWGSTGDIERFLDALVELKYRFNDSWDVGIGARWYQREIVTTDWYNDYARRQYVMAFGYSF